MAWPLTTGGRIRLIVLVLLAGLVVGSVLYYSSDPALDADVVDKRCGPLSTSAIVVETRLFGIRHTTPVEVTQCGAVPLGAYVVYHVRSQRTIVYEAEGGRCIWDSASLCT